MGQVSGTISDFFFVCLPPDEQYTVELIQLTITLVNKREFI